MKVGEQFEVVDGDVNCAYCAEHLGSVNENFKRNLAIEETGNEEAGPHYGDASRYVDAEMVFRKFYCPSCGTMLFTESAEEGAPIVDEFTIKQG